MMVYQLGKPKRTQDIATAYHLLQAAALNSSSPVHLQVKGFRLGGYQLLFLWQDHIVKVWQWLGLKLRGLFRRKTNTCDLPTSRPHRLRDSEAAPTSSFLSSASLFSFNARLSRSRSSKEKGQTSTRWCSGRRGWKGRPKWGTGGALTGEGGFTWWRDEQNLSSRN